MRIVLACEGECEIALINCLLNKRQLSFKNEILLGEPLKLRQLNEISSIINMLPKDEELIVFRIGDTLNDKQNFKNLEMRKEYIKFIKICTKTEIEILPIINEGLYDEFLKYKSKIRPKEFAKQRIKKFDFIKYINEHDMMFCIHLYKHLKGKTHLKNEYCLSDLIDTFAKKY